MTLLLKLFDLNEKPKLSDNFYVYIFPSISNLLKIDTTISKLFHVYRLRELKGLKQFLKKDARLNQKLDTRTFNQKYSGQYILSPLIT